jgi:hypothetical protein
LLLKLGQAYFTGKRFVGSVTKENERWLHGKYLLNQAPIAFARRIKPGSRFTPYRIAAPAKVAERDVALGPPARKKVLPVAITLLALDKRAAHEDYAIAVNEFKWFRGISSCRREPEQRSEQRDKTGFSQKASPR